MKNIFGELGDNISFEDFMIANCDTS